jgi:hypothetical protein
MADKKEATLYDYNIYRIDYEAHDEFIKYLEARTFENIPLKQSLLPKSPVIGFTLMYCDKENKKGSNWVKLLDSCTDDDLTQEIHIYGAALICKGSDFCYVISYGNAHFYISNFVNITLEFHSQKESSI